MPGRKPFEKLCYYHIYNRGFQKQTLFFTEDDFKRFQNLIHKNIERFKRIEVIEYCILPNHFHFIIQSKKTGYDISKFMKNVCGTYATYYFFRYGQQAGIPIYEGRFKSLVLPSLKYLENCIHYVQHNAKNHEIVTKREERQRQSTPYNNKLIINIDNKIFNEKKIEY